jgi:hypothetical protein
MDREFIKNQKESMIFLLASGITTHKKVTGIQIQDTIGFLLYSCCVRYFFVSDGFLQGENKKNTRTQQEHSWKNMLKNRNTPF